MNTPNKQFNTSLQRLQNASLSRESKDRMLSEITGVGASVASPYSPWASWGRKLAAGMTITSLGCTSLAFASTASLPDELLYPVKTDIVEPLVELVKLSAESKQEYQIALANERLEELIALEQDNKLDAELRREIESDFVEHITEAETYPETETSEDALALALAAFVAVASDESDSLVEHLLDLDTDQDLDLDADTAIDVDTPVLDIDIDTSVDIVTEVTTPVVDTPVLDDPVEEVVDTVDDVTDTAGDLVDDVVSPTDTPSDSLRVVPTIKKSLAL